MLIDCSYFTKGARHILNSSMGTIPDPNAIAVMASVEAYIAENQELFLMKMLGVSLSNKVHNYLICRDEDENTAPQVNFDAVCDRLRESFADYVFFKYLRDINTQVTATGTVRLKNANTAVSPIQRQVSIWNSMVDKNRLFASWCISSECNLSGISVSESMITKINSLNI